MNFSEEITVFSYLFIYKPFNTINILVHLTFFLYSFIVKNYKKSNVIVYYAYYAPREEKTWTVHSSCKLPPEPKARVANTICGLANFIPVVGILFFAIPGPKTPHSRFGAGRECGTFGQGMAKKC